MMQDFRVLKFVDRFANVFSFANVFTRMCRLQANEKDTTS